MKRWTQNFRAEVFWPPGAGEETLVTRSAHLWEHVQPSGLPGSRVVINRNVSLFRGHLGGYFGMCTDQTSAVYDTKAAARWERPYLVLNLN